MVASIATFQAWLTTLAIVTGARCSVVRPVWAGLGSPTRELVRSPTSRTITVFKDGPGTLELGTGACGWVVRASHRRTAPNRPAPHKHRAALRCITLHCTALHRASLHCSAAYGTATRHVAARCDTGGACVECCGACVCAVRWGAVPCGAVRAALHRTAPHRTGLNGLAPHASHRIAPHHTSLVGSRRFRQPRKRLECVRIFKRGVKNWAPTENAVRSAV